MSDRHQMIAKAQARGGVDHDGWYDPWKELEKPEVAVRYEECLATGGFAFRTGVYDMETGRHYGDGLQFVHFVRETGETP